MNFEEVLERERNKLGLSNTDTLAGLALSGGGVRAAMVSRGVMDFFKQKALLQRFAYVSAVSGGGYAASEMLEELSGQPTAARSLDAPGYSNRGALMTVLTEVLVRAIYLMIIAFLLLLWTQTAIAEQRQGHWALGGAALATSVGIFVMAISLRSAIAVYLVRMPHKKTILRRYRHYPRLVMALVFIFWGYRCVANIVATDPTLLIYGTWQTYALMVVCVAVPLASRQWLKRLDLHWKFQEPLFSYYRYHLKQCFTKRNDDLTKFASAQRPFPIFNVTANDDEQILPFELTPIACGSASTYFIATDELPMVVTLADAMAISGSAIDLVNHEWSWTDLLSLFSGGTGCWFPHFKGKLKLTDELSLGVKILTNVPSKRMPRLYDGGFSDNLGIISLLRRRAKLIVCVDAAYDPEFNFEDLRKVCSLSVSEKLAVIDAAPIQKLMHDLRFEGDTDRYVTLNVSYLNPETTATILYVKLAARARQPIPSRSTFWAFPQITTDDQRLTSTQLNDLYNIGRHLGDECMQAVQSLLKVGATLDTATTAV
ncbi:hypothetical protein GTP81_04765 [Rugamonas sp. FT107W]|uniref:PNPLA domain-containing protein n=1 Tax=Duganella vulcania TaxID=2692166 RepID=A0A845HHC0_9BURK|nr:hypothetical protein [Duganella vulcania]MYN16056.1 hypothetical protein [Duganella vulcania]